MLQPIFRGASFTATTCFHSMNSPSLIMWRVEVFSTPLLLEGISNLTRLPPRTVLFFEGGATIRIDGDNLPCRVAGRAIASQFDGREDLEMAFPKQSDGMRGLVAWVEKEGTIKMGEVFEARIPPQWIYQA